MALRAILLTALAAFLFNGIVRADDAPKLPGSGITIGDTVAKADVIFAGQLTSLGTPDLSLAHASVGPENRGAEVTIVSLYKGTAASQISVSIGSNLENHEVMPRAGESYIFFLEKNGPGNDDPFTVLKLLPATKDNEKTVILAILHARAQAKLLEIEKEKSGN